MRSAFTLRRALAVVTGTPLAVILARAALARLNDAVDRLECLIVGHQASWTLAEQLGYVDGPVCKRCYDPLGGARDAG